MEPFAFDVTQADLDGLDSDAFDAVWTALGIVLRSRGRKVAEPVTLALNGPSRLDLSPLGVLRIPAPKPKEVEEVSTSGVRCPECGEEKKNGAGLSAHRRFAHKVAAKVKRVNGQPMIDSAKAREHEAVRATAEAIRAREPQPHTNGASAFEAKAAARHAETWADRHPETA